MCPLNRLFLALKTESYSMLSGIQTRQKYKGQRVYVIEIEGYAYMVPYLEDDEFIFLKTIFPSRKYTKKYLRKDEK